MIFYFSGTGNSKWVAESLAEEFKEKLVFIPDAINKDEYRYCLAQGERLGFVFPCHAWAVPEFIVEFIDRLKIDNVSYIYYVCTCGDDTGQLKEQFCRLMDQKGWTCSMGYDIVMPESYVCLPGFDVDDEFTAKHKQSIAKTRLEFLVDDITDQRVGVFEVIPGKFAGIKSGVLNWAFRKWLMTPEKFTAESFCKGCGTCVSECPMHNITLQSGRPVWGDSCVNCLRCYHACPQHAIEWGKWTKNKGQYLYKKQKTV